MLCNNDALLGFGFGGRAEMGTPVPVSQGEWVQLLWAEDSKTVQNAFVSELRTLASVLKHGPRPPQGQRPPES